MTTHIMQNMKRVGLVAVMTFMALPALAQTMNSQTYSYSASSHSSIVPVISGGVGVESEASLKDAEQRYTLKLIFTGVKGSYLSGVDVFVKDKNDNLYISETSEGPILLAALEPGQYTVEASHNGTVKTQGFTIPKNGGLRIVQIRFPIPEDVSTSDSDEPIYKKHTRYNADKSCVMTEEYKDGQIIKSQNCKVKLNKPKKEKTPKAE